MNPAKVKEQVIHQLKNQIVDLERFVVYLQDEAQSPLVLSASEEPCECEVHKLVSERIIFIPSNNLIVGLHYLKLQYVSKYTNPPNVCNIFKTLIIYLTFWSVRKRPCRYR